MKENGFSNQATSRMVLWFENNPEAYAWIKEVIELKCASPYTALDYFKAYADEPSMNDYLAFKHQKINWKEFFNQFKED